MSILIGILAVVFVLGIAINIHEFGHFAVAKLLGMRVDAYSFFGLGPRLFGFKVGNTDYRVSAIPLGAYVKLYGDEGSGTLEGADNQSEAVPESELYELRPRWQKFLVMIGGPFMNILLALAVPFGLALTQGVPATPAPIIEYVKPAGAGAQAGIKAGDRIDSFGGIENPTWQQIQDDSMLSPEKEIPIIVERGGERIPLTIKPTKITDSGSTLGMLDIEPAGETEPVVAEMVKDDSPAAQGGLEKGDLIMSFNGTAIRNPTDAKEKVVENGTNPLRVVVNRNGETRELTLNAKVESDSVPRIGVQFGNNYAKARQRVNVAQAASYALNFNVRVLRMTAKAFGQVSTGERAAGETFSGPIGIVQLISQIANNASFADLLGILALISLNLGIFNLLPIPMLDGGQIMVLGIEGALGVGGYSLSTSIREKIQMVGFAVILLLMVFTIFNDVSRFFR